ncbi:MAG: MarR family transcriptional regulator [Pseudomonadota bacterium]
MDEALENTLGALALALSDDIGASIQTSGFVQSEVEAIGHLGHAPEMTISDLSSAIALSHAATVRLVTRLEAKGLVSRSQSTLDARKVILKLTAQGEDLHETLLGRRQGRLRSALQVLSPQEKSQFSTLTNRILRAMLRDESHAFRVCRLCDRPVCASCPVEAEMVERSATSAE